MKTVDRLRAEIAELRALFTARIGVLEREFAAQGAEVSRLLGENAQLLRENDRLLRENAELKKKILGRTTERSGPRPKKNPPRKPNDAGAQTERENARDARADVPEVDVPHELPADVKASCPECHGAPLEAMPPETSSEWEWLKGRPIRRRHRRERAVCPKCNGFATAPAPLRVTDGGLYGPNLVAKTVINKVIDAIPLHRQSAMWAREGFPLSRSTLGDLFHRAASLLEPLYVRMLALVATARIVYADETSLKMQHVKKLGYVWTFATEDQIVYVFSRDRSGETPARILGDSEGLLVVDGYTGYNAVTMPGKRVRAGCNAHARRKFTDIEDPIAHAVIEHYKTVFDVERIAKERGIVGTVRHAELRAAESRAAMDAIHALCEANRESVGPKTPLGEAMRYVRNQWKPLSRFLDEIEIEPSNNLSERLLRRIALGRRNYLFVGHEDAGRNLAILASMLQSCALHDIDPQDYVADVLLRVQEHPASRIDELLPANWARLRA